MTQAPADEPSEGQDQAGRGDLAGSGPAESGPAGSDPAARDQWPARRLTMTRGRRVAEAVMAPLIRAGMIPHTYQLVTVGRRSGLTRTNPVTLVDQDGRRWLVAPYGPVGWVHNARAAGRVSILRRAEQREYLIREVDPDEAGPVLKRYLAVASATRPYFTANKQSSVAEFVAEADRHPVFELRPLPKIN